MNLFFKTVRRTLSGRLSFITYTVFLLYLILPGMILNIRLLLETFSSSASLAYKLSLSSQILLGYITMSRGFELLLLFLTAILLGMNVALLFDSISHLRQAKRISLSIGTTSIVGLTASGCASCGVSVLSVLGISSSFIAVHNTELYIFSIALLLLSLFVTAQTHAKVCKLH